jgi:hypothetical protein
MLKYLSATTLLLFTTLLVGCGEGAADAGGNGAKQGGRQSAPRGPAPQAQGTFTDDASAPRISIPRVAAWEEYVAEHKAANGGEEPPEPRTRDDIYEDEQWLPTLYLTDQSNTRVVREGNVGRHRDAESGEMCSPASGCYNTACPQRGEDGEPYAFTYSSNSELGRVCPACLEARDLESETAADRDRYGRFTHPYELPEARALRRELTAERRQRIAWERANR